MDETNAKRKQLQHTHSHAFAVKMLWSFHSLSSRGISCWAATISFGWNKEENINIYKYISGACAARYVRACCARALKRFLFGLANLTHSRQTVRYTRELCAQRGIPLFWWMLNAAALSGCGWCEWKVWSCEDAGEAIIKICKLKTSALTIFTRIAIEIPIDCCEHIVMVIALILQTRLCELLLLLLLHIRIMNHYLRVVFLSLSLHIRVVRPSTPLFFVFVKN